MNRQEALRIYDSGKEEVIEKLLSLAKHIRQLERSIAALTRNSSNSSRPPSSDPPGIKKAKKKSKSNRKQGGQPGHKGKNRKLLPAEAMDKIHDIFPERCEHCRSPFSTTLINPFAKPFRYQVFDLPVYHFKLPVVLDLPLLLLMRKDIVLTYAKAYAKKRGNHAN